MVAGLFWMATANAAALLGAHALWRRIRCGNSTIDPVLFIIVHLLIVSVAVIAAGLFGFLSPAPLGGAGLIVLILLLFRREHRSLSSFERPDIGRFTLILTILIGVRLLLQVWFLAPCSGDSVAYHLPKIGEWVRASRFTREMGLDLAATFPAGFEVVETWWVVFLHHDALIELAGVEFALLGFAGVRALSLGLGLSSRGAWRASALYALTPVFSMQATSCMNDGPAAALVLAVVALVHARAHPLLILLPLALSLGIKGTVFYALPGVALLAWVRHRESTLRPSSMSWTWSLCGLAALTGATWYLRNWLWFGNPTYPVTSEGLRWGTAVIQAGPRASSLFANLAELLNGSVYDNQDRYQPISARIAGWGVIGFAIGAPALVQAAREDRNLRLLAASFGLSLVGVLLMVAVDDWCFRFVLFFPALICIAASRLVDRSYAVKLLLGVAVLFQFATTLLPQELDDASMANILNQSWRERSLGPVLGFDAIPAGEAVAVYANTRSPTYPLYRADFSRRVVYLRADDASAMKAQMDQAGVRWLYANVTTPRLKGELEIMVKINELRAINANVYCLP